MLTSSFPASVPSPRVSLIANRSMAGVQPALRRVAPAVRPSTASLDAGSASRWSSRRRELFFSGLGVCEAALESDTEPRGRSPSVPMQPHPFPQPKPSGLQATRCRSTPAFCRSRGRPASRRCCYSFPAALGSYWLAVLQRICHAIHHGWHSWPQLVGECRLLLAAGACAGRTPSAFAAAIDASPVFVFGPVSATTQSTDLPVRVSVRAPCIRGPRQPRPPRQREALR